MDFYNIREKQNKNGTLEISPTFKVTRSKDLMVRGRAFYAIWDEDAGLWSTDEYDVQRIVDQDMWKHVSKAQEAGAMSVIPKFMGDFDSNSWLNFRNYVSHISDSYVQLDEDLTFLNTEVKKEDYVSRRLPYSLIAGSIAAYDELISTLYSPEERAKLEWAIGAIIAGEAKYIQKFIVLYGAAGAGKSTVLNLIQKIFEGYYVAFEAASLTRSSNAFSTEVFKSNPLLAIQHDGDLSKIEDNTKLNSIVSHEEMQMNEKYKPSYMSRINAFLFMATNKPVKITDAKSGIIRRLIDVQPTGDKVAPNRYQVLMSQIDFELGAIAHHCLTTYRNMGKNYYANYHPVEMMLQTDVFYNFIEDNYNTFSTVEGISLRQAYALYKEYCEETSLEYQLAQHRFREELKNYFSEFEPRKMVDGVQMRSWYSGFISDRFRPPVDDTPLYRLTMDDTTSIFDREFADYPAQYATERDTPYKKWADVDTKLSDIDTSRVHYVKVPENHIVIDFDLKDDDGNKSAERNIAAASEWPPTYSEFSKGGGGVHLHYLYEGPVDELRNNYSDGIEVKVFTGGSSLRRRLSKCNSTPVATLSGGLPLKEKKVINADVMIGEKGIRDLIARNLRKEIHPGTKPSVDFIHKILEDAYSSGVQYDVTDLRSKILTFANNSTNQALAAIKTVKDMKFKSEVSGEDALEEPESPEAAKPADDRLVFFDCEVFPNLFVLNWKFEDAPNVVRMINPSPSEVEELMRMKLVGFNCRKYDNHILYGRFMGYNNEQLYKLSVNIINNVPGSTFGEAYNLSYTDIYDYSSKKQSLKKWQLELGIHHQELGLPWDQPVPEELWPKVAEYCDNDVISTEATHKARKADFVARQVLAELSGLTVNQTTQKHTAKIIFGNDRKPQDKFVYTELATGDRYIGQNNTDVVDSTDHVTFPGYTYQFGKSEYRGIDPSEGGYVYSEPGIHENVALLDVTSLHPTSIEQLNLFGPYTKNFTDLLKARVAIKRGDYESARKMFDGRLVPYLKSEEDAEALSYALKIAINIVYGLTSAKFDNPFRDIRNVDNIVAKRGALFMIDLKYAVEEMGYTVAHIKTDSIKIPNADKKIIDFIMEFGQKYGYNFEHEATYDRLCLVNDAVYIAHAADGRKPAHWDAVGAQFQHPYVFKTLFSGEEITFDDLTETKSVTTALYLDFSDEEDEAMALSDTNNDKLRFVGRAGTFVPIKEGHGGAHLVREKDGKFYSATGAKGYYWLEAEYVHEMGKEDDIDMSYFEALAFAAKEQIRKYGDFDEFVNPEDHIREED